MRPSAALDPELPAPLLILVHGRTLCASELLAISLTEHSSSNAMSASGMPDGGIGRWRSWMWVCSA